MTLSSGLFGATFRDQMDTSALGADLLTDDMKSALVTDTFTPAFNTDTQWSDVDNEVTGTGYTTKGNSITSQAWNTTISTSHLTFDGATPDWTSATISNIEGRILLDEDLTNDNIWSCTDFGSPYTVTSGTFSITEDASGIMRVTL